jgi:hypothetical protein
VPQFDILNQRHPDAWALPLVSRRNSPNSFSGTTNSDVPQSKQTISCGNIQTVGLSMFFSPGERMPISPMNVCWLTDPHDLQGMLASEENYVCIITNLGSVQYSG